MPPQLDVAHSAFSSALSVFGTDLDTATSQMATERTQAEAAWSARTASLAMFTSTTTLHP